MDAGDFFFEGSKLVRFCFLHAALVFLAALVQHHVCLSVGAHHDKQATLSQDIIFVRSLSGIVRIHSNFHCSNSTGKPVSGLVGCCSITAPFCAI